uniref:Uncharacterized protein n=1 Tax=viral metagenome TaxID=1070528 RepID=A0A6C0FHI5_9ZZZZ|tara:strand:+ start:6473 stop:6715 length:243 start_codon:yes stop_codon:yes gene_type:complete
MIGGIELQKIYEEFKLERIFNLSITVIIILLIRSYIVQKTYNLMWPKIVRNTGGDDSKFTSLTFYESIMVVLLFSFLFKS